MELNLHTAFDMDSKSLREMFEGLREPAIILDESLKTVSKNKIAARIFPKLRKGCRVGGLMVAEDKKKLLSLSVRQTVLVKLLNGETVYGAMAVRFSKEILLLVRPLSAGLRERLEEIYNKASGYDINIFAEQPTKDRLLDFSLKNLCFTGENRFFDVSVVTEGVINQLSLNHRRVFEKIALKSSLNNRYALGSEYDFSIMLTYIISFCIQSTKEKVGIELLDKNGVLSVTVNATPPEDMKEAEELINEFPKDNICWQSLIKMLSDGNLWDLEMDYGYKKPVSFTVKMPVAEETQPFVLSDALRQAVAKILSAFFD